MTMEDWNMRRLLSLIVFVPTIAFGQTAPTQQSPTTTQRWQGLVGNCIGENIELASRIDQLNQQVQLLSKALEEAKKEQPNAK